MNDSKIKIVEAALSWREHWCDQGDSKKAEGGCTCEICKLIRACDEYAKNKTDG